jgi:hypothetical protein
LIKVFLFFSVVDEFSSAKAAAAEEEMVAAHHRRVRYDANQSVSSVYCSFLVFYVQNSPHLESVTH